MAEFNMNISQYTSENFVESAGAILFNVSKRQICLVRYVKKDQWLLAKGRRNIGESRKSAAEREAEEETGYRCSLLPVKITTRATPDVEDDSHYHKPRTYENLCEPFMVSNFCS